MTPREVILCWLDAFNKKDAKKASELYHEDAVNAQASMERPLLGKEAIHKDLLDFFRAFPDNHTDLENLFEDGEWAIIEWHGEGTFRGEFRGFPPTNKSYSLRGCGFFHVKEAKIVFQRSYWDKLTFYEQIGLPIR